MRALSDGERCAGDSGLCYSARRTKTSAAHSTPPAKHSVLLASSHTPGCRTRAAFAALVAVPLGPAEPSSTCEKRARHQ